MLIDGIDMDGDLSDEFTVLDGDELRAERKGKKANIDTHCECDPLVPINLDIAVWEVDSIGAADVLEKIGEAAGLATEAGLLSGHAWIGKAAEELDEIGKAIDELGNDETSLGTESGIVPDGLFVALQPYHHLPLPDAVHQNGVRIDEKCSGTTRETGWERVGDPTLDDLTHDFFKYIGMGLG